VNGNLIQVIHPGTGKVMNKRKHRVKWFDSPVISYELRFFIATASSKIVELSGDLDIIYEDTYAGGRTTAFTLESIEENERYIVSNFKPNEIIVLQKSDTMSTAL
jgi:hypothetical protein